MKDTFNMNDETLAKTAMAIATLVVETLNRHGVTCTATDQTPTGPFLETGSLYLECDGTTPIGIWTPWGKLKAWTSIGQGHEYAAAIAELTTRLGLEVHIPFKTIPNAGAFGPNREGPVYLIMRLDDLQIPPSHTVRKTTDWKQREADWQRLTR